MSEALERQVEVADATEEPTLLPCPFCGGDAAEGMFSVWCDKCGAGTAANSDASTEQIRAAWNARIPSAVHSALVAALEQLVDECTPQGRDLEGKSITVTRIPRQAVIDQARAALSLVRGENQADQNLG